MNEATRILFVDDEKRLRDTVHQLWTSRGYDVFMAEDGQVALDILSKTPVDTMLLDLKMPVMGGAEVLEITRTKYPYIALSYSCQDLKPVQADPKNIEELLNNLITNAINYSPNGGKVTVTAQGLGQYLEIKVEDTGVGIPPEEIPKIFDKFYRVKHRKTRKVMGTGLGLAIVKGIVEAHHGRIDVESVLDKGTTFKILLPVITTS